MSNLVEGGHGFFNFFKGGHLQKSLGNSALYIVIKKHYGYISHLFFEINKNYIIVVLRPNFFHGYVENPTYFTTRN